VINGGLPGETVYGEIPGVESGGIPRREMKYPEGNVLDFRRAG